MFCSGNASPTRCMPSRRGNEQGVRPLRVKNDGTVLCLKMEKL